MFNLINIFTVKENLYRILLYLCMQNFFFNFKFSHGFLLRKRHSVMYQYYVRSRIFYNMKKFAWSLCPKHHVLNTRISLRLSGWNSRSFSHFLDQKFGVSSQCNRATRDTATLHRNTRDTPRWHLIAMRKLWDSPRAPLVARACLWRAFHSPSEFILLRFLLHPQNHSHCYKHPEMASTFPLQISASEKIFLLHFSFLLYS